MSNRFIPGRETGPNADTTQTGGNFEFTSNDNEVFRAIASVMKFVGVVGVVFGVLEAISGLANGVTVVGLLTVGQGVAMIAIGGWLASAAGSFRDIAETQGNDIGYLMLAMSKLRSVYTLQAWMIGIAIVLTTISIIMKLRS
jgi:hypothetical protein